MSRHVPTEPLRGRSSRVAPLDRDAPPWVLCELRREAQAEAELAYQAWSGHPGRDGHAVHRAAQDRAGAAQDALAAWTREGHGAGAYRRRPIGRDRSRPSSSRDNTFLCYLRDLYILSLMPTDAELTFADHMGRFYARRYGFPPMVGRLIGYLAVCDPPDQSINELADALLASRSAIANAVKTLEAMRLLSRTRAAGERMDRVRIDMSSPNATGMDSSEYEELRELAREGLHVLQDEPVERRAVLLEMSAFADFLLEQLPRMRQEWEKRRAALVAARELPQRPEHRGR